MVLAEQKISGCGCVAWSADNIEEVRLVSDLYQGRSSRTDVAQLAQKQQVQYKETEAILPTIPASLTQPGLRSGKVGGRLQVSYYVTNSGRWKRGRKLAKRNVKQRAKDVPETLPYRAT